jgi:DNA replication protein DnaC
MNDILSFLQMQMMYRISNENNVCGGALLLFVYYIIVNYKRIRRFEMNFRTKNMIILEGHRIKDEYKTFYTDMFSTRFKAIWDYIKEGEFEDITGMKEISSYEYVYDDEESEKKTIEENMFLVEQDKHFTLYNNIFCKIYSYNNHTEKSNNNKKSETEIITIEIYSYEKTVSQLRTFVDKLKHNYENKLSNYRKNKKFIYMLNATNAPDNRMWSEYEFNSYKTFDNLFFDGKTELINKIDFFNENKQFYDKFGITHTLGLALSGPPGTGKTSIVKCIANYLNRHIIIIPINKIKSLDELYRVFFESTYNTNNKKNSISFVNKIILIEDIDCMDDIVKKRSVVSDSGFSDSDEYDERSSKKKTMSNFKKVLEKTKEKLTLSDILNIIDGIVSTPDRILIMTSNHYNKLDPALVRPGRIDYHIEMGNASEDTIKEIYLKYFNKELTVNNLKTDISPAQLVNYAISGEKNFIRNVTY